MHLTSGAGDRRDGDPWNGDPIAWAVGSVRLDSMSERTPSRAGTARTGSRRGRRGGTDVDAANGRRDERVVVSGQRPSGHLDVGRRASGSGLTCARANPEDDCRRLRRLVAVPARARARGDTRRRAWHSGRRDGQSVAPSAGRHVRTDSRRSAPGGAERDAAAEPSVAAGAWNQATLVATDSDPAEALIQVARDHRAELIVVGHTGSGYVTRALLGSTAENVVRHAPCDVLVVR